MPRIFDNIEHDLLPALQETLRVSERADFCVGYFNLWGWRQLDQYFDSWEGNEGNCCRLLIGMQQTPIDEVATERSLLHDDQVVDLQTALRLKKQVAEEFKKQLCLGAPSAQEEAGLRRLSAQLKARKVVIKLHLRYKLHAKLYLLHRQDPNNPVAGFVGSSNLTLAGLSKQGELNVDVLDHDSCIKLQRWFDQRWADQRSLDISSELADIIDNSWAREEQVPPHHIYLKIAYHISQEARAGLAEFQLPDDLSRKLFPYQAAAVKIAAHHMTKRGGVLIGDVVGLGKTLMATALIRMLEEEDDGISTLIICPRSLVSMWRDHVDDYGLRAKVISMGSVERELKDVPARFRRVLIDESHNLRNRQGSRYLAIQRYIETTASRVILLSATPYNKSYQDLASQLQLFLPENSEIGVRPESLLREIGESAFLQKFQCSPRSLKAFEKSEHASDWRELMRLFLVRRTRSFIQEHYAETDATDGRKFLLFDDGTRSYFPTRVPKTIKFEIDDADPNDQYARLYGANVVDAINALDLPRYGLANYVVPDPLECATLREADMLKNLSRAGKRLMGFCRTNLFKRLESSGTAFLTSVDRHILRNYVFVFAIENGLPLPIGKQNASMLDQRNTDEDVEVSSLDLGDHEDDLADLEFAEVDGTLHSEMQYFERARAIYQRYCDTYYTRFTWIRPSLFSDTLGVSLRSDAHLLIEVLRNCGAWQAESDTKLSALYELVTVVHPDEKILLFTQFADTARYLKAQFALRAVPEIACVTGSNADPTGYAWRFSPASNNKTTKIAPEARLRILFATDVLSEGQNLQDAYIVVNYDLPWAIIRLIQRAGRVDRIGQKSSQVLCYSFLPADGVERIINLRGRVGERLTQNAEVVGTDELFFEDEISATAVLDLYNEKSGILDGENDNEVDLSSFAYQIWKNATDADPSLLNTIPALPALVYSTKSAPRRPRLGALPSVVLQPPRPMGVTAVQSSSDSLISAPRGGADGGVLVYLRTAQDNDALAWIGPDLKSVTESQFAILKAAECSPETAPLPRIEQHHSLVKKGVELLIREEQAGGGQLGRASGARYKVYERLKLYAGEVAGKLFEPPGLLKAIDTLYRFPLRASTAEGMNRRLKAGITDEELADLVINLWADDRLCQVSETDDNREPQIICSLGLSTSQQG